MEPAVEKARARAKQVAAITFGSSRAFSVFLEAGLRSSMFPLAGLLITNPEQVSLAG
jgi:hypothetical protein